MELRTEYKLRDENRNLANYIWFYMIDGLFVAVDILSAREYFILHYLFKANTTVQYVVLTGIFLQFVWISLVIFFNIELCTSYGDENREFANYIWCGITVCCCRHIIRLKIFYFALSFLGKHCSTVCSFN